MPQYWITFENGGGACRHGETEQDAMDSAERITGRKPVKAARLPYPATPRILLPEERPGAIPSFCMDGRGCAGRSSCPRPRSCVE